MRELTFHQAADAVRAGKDILLAKRFTKSLVNTAFFDAERYFIEDTEAAEAPNPKRKPAIRKTVDVGRICALYKAGWPVKQVAEDVKCSEATVVIKLKDAGIYNGPKPAKAMEKGEE